MAAVLPSRRLADLGLRLPAVPPPAGAYVPAVEQSGWVWTAGQLPVVDGKLVRAGLVGPVATDGILDADEAADLARVCALNALAAAASVVGGIDGIARIVKVVGFVASAPGFTAQPRVINGASDLLVDVFGEAGRHARSAVGVSALPLDAPVELELLAVPV
jgi:enamine deaminase RidA (YjgF/YER057c/UK114 family)